MHGKRQNCEADVQEYWDSWFLTKFLHSLTYSILFSLGLLRTKFQVAYQILYFQVYGNMERKT